ncbi:alpha-amylase, partial [Vibrio parahaemolyticus]|nr:alpha-amylase [Vibrio parahaemolyticus]
SDPRMAKMIQFHNMTHGEPMSVLEGNDDMLVLKRGDKGIVVLNKSQRQQSLTLKTDGNWVDLMTEQIIPTDGKLIVPSKSSMLLVAN